MLSTETEGPKGRKTEGPKAQEDDNFQDLHNSSNRTKAYSNNSYLSNKDAYLDRF